MANAQYEPQTQDESDLYYTFANYKTSVSIKRPDFVIKYMDPNTLHYLDSIIPFIKTADSTTLMNCPFTEMYYTLYVRFMAPEGKIEQIKNREDLIGFLVNSFITQGLLEMEIQDIDVAGDSAEVYVIKEGKAEDAPYYFIKKGEDWKIDLYRSIVQANKSFELFINDKEMMEKYQLTRAKVIQSIIRENKWDQATRNIWYPQK